MDEEYRELEDKWGDTPDVAGIWRSRRDPAITPDPDEYDEFYAYCVPRGEL